MKKLLLICIFILSYIGCRCQSFSNYESFVTTTVVEKSLDPRSNDYIMYWNNIFSIQSKSVSSEDVQSLFTFEDHVQKDGDILYSIHPRYYKLYIPTDSIIFLVRLQDTKQEMLDRHLKLFIQTVKIWQETQKIK